MVGGSGVAASLAGLARQPRRGARRRAVRGFRLAAIIPSLAPGPRLSMKTGQTIAWAIWGRGQDQFSRSNSRTRGQPSPAARVYSFPTWAGIAEDDASGAAAVLVGDRLRREATIRQGVGSEIRIQLGPDGTVDVGGACALVNVRDYPE